jgi:hypothetical protein
MLHSGATSFDPTRHRGARNAKPAGEATPTAALLGGAQDLLAANFGIGIVYHILLTYATTDEIVTTL